MDKTFKDIKNGSPIFKVNDETGDITTFYPNMAVFSNDKRLIDFFINNIHMLRCKANENERMLVGIRESPTYIFCANEVDALKRSYQIHLKRIEKLENGLRQWKKEKF